MRIKKKTSIMLLAASVAATVGVGAVSFAQWTGSNATTIQASGATGSAYLFGFEQGASDLSFNEKLVPFNQRNNTIKEGQTVVTAALPSYTVYSEKYTITIATTDVAADKVAASENTTYYVSIDESKDAPAAAFAGAEDTNWYKVTAAGAVIEYGAPATAAAHTVSGRYVHVAMVSEETGDMDKAFAFEITLKTVEDNTTSQS